MKEVILKLVVVVGVLMLFPGFFITTGDVPTSSELMEERAKGLCELRYSDEVIFDQLQEEFYETDGIYNTGGVDGLLLDGTAAPNSPYGNNPQGRN